jgi:hypothetical protein
MTCRAFLGSQRSSFSVRLPKNSPRPVGSEASLLYVGPFLNLQSKKSKAFRERTACRVRREKKTVRSRMEQSMPRRDKSIFRHLRGPLIAMDRIETDRMILLSKVQIVPAK